MPTLFFADPPPLNILPLVSDVDIPLAISVTVLHMTIIVII